MQLICLLKFGLPRREWFILHVFLADIFFYFFNKLTETNEAAFVWVDAKLWIFSWFCEKSFWKHNKPKSNQYGMYSGLHSCKHRCFAGHDSQII